MLLAVFENEMKVVKTIQKYHPKNNIGLWLCNHISFKQCLRLNTFVIPLVNWVYLWKISIIKFNIPIIYVLLQTEGCTKDSLYGKKYIREIYFKAMPGEIPLTSSC